MPQQQRIALDDLRAKIDAYRRAADDQQQQSSDGLVRLLSAQLDAWETAYLWHVGVTREVLRGFPLAGSRAEQNEFEAFQRERDEGMKLIREKLAT